MPKCLNKGCIHNPQNQRNILDFYLSGQEEALLFPQMPEPENLKAGIWNWGRFLIITRREKKMYLSMGHNPRGARVKRCRMENWILMPNLNQVKLCETSTTFQFLQFCLFWSLVTIRVPIGKYSKHDLP